MMKKIVIVPDSFKGTLSASRICEILSSCVHRFFKDCETVCVPLADGGEGTAQCLCVSLGGTMVCALCKGPFAEDMTASYAVIGSTAAVELAAASGLPLVSGREDAERTTTFGVGQLIMHAVNGGAKHILLCLGGSSTNDFGCGMAAACGIKFYDKSGNSFVPTGGTLINVDKIDLSGRAEQLKNVRFTAMCDITNPVYGKNGAAYVFAPQKGADRAAVERLDNGLYHICSLIKRDFGISLDELPGGGAAGAAGAGSAFFFGAELCSGAHAVLDAADFRNQICNADLIITGEGRLDSQSSGGKAISCVCEYAKDSGIPVIAIVGGTDCTQEQLMQMGLTAAFPIGRLPQSLDISAPHSEAYLRDTADSIMSLIRQVTQK